MLLQASCSVSWAFWKIVARHGLRVAAQHKMLSISVKQHLVFGMQNSHFASMQCISTIPCTQCGPHRDIPIVSAAGFCRSFLRLFFWNVWVSTGSHQRGVPEIVPQGIWITLSRLGAAFFEQHLASKHHFLQRGVGRAFCCCRCPLLDSDRAGKASQARFCFAATAHARDFVAAS